MSTSSEMGGKQNFAKPIIEHKKYFIFVLIIGLVIGWNLRPLMENSLVKLTSTLTADQWLVLVTLVYVVLTFWLVKETRKSREQDRKRAIEKRSQEKESLRRAIVAEIEQNLDKIESLDTSRNNVEFGGDVFYSDIYLNNSDRIGILTSSESEAVVEAFTNIVETQRLITKGLKVDDNHGIGFTGLASSRIEDLRPKLERAREEIETNVNAGSEESSP